MRIAVIDCGTNTFNLLVADAGPSEWNVVFQSKLPVKLGSGGFEDGIIIPSRFIRGIDALYCHMQNTRNYNCQKVFAYATSALRESKNGIEFIQSAKEITGVDIVLISGDREAELIYNGVKQTHDFGKEKVLVMDIGGGSTEFIIADSEQIFWKKSFLLGVSRLNDFVKPEDRMSAVDLEYLNKMLERDLQPLIAALKEYPVKKLVGSSGSFDTLLALHQFQSGIPEQSADLFSEIPIKSFFSIHQWLVRSSVEERMQHKVIPSMRAEYMPLASCLVKYVLDLHAFTSLCHSAYSLKEGAMQVILKSIDWPAPHGEINENPEDYLEG